MAKETAYVLPEGVAASSEPQVFPGMPGRYTPGVPVTVTELGMTASEAAELVSELGLPLKRTTAEPPKVEEPAEPETKPVVEDEEAAS